MAPILGYIAATLDGYIARPDGSIDWLTKYDTADFGEHDYRTFIKRIRTLVMGRGTYEFFEKENVPWPYDGHRVIVVTSRPIPNPLGELEIRHDIDSLIQELRALDDGNVWMLGGGQLQNAFIERGALDELEVYIIPEMIGGGIPLFPATGIRTSPTLLSAQTLGSGCVRLHYRFETTPKA